MSCAIKLQQISGVPGITGLRGWTPVLAIKNDNSRRVLEVSDWTGSGGTKPTVGVYLGPVGLVANISDAVDIGGAPVDAALAAQAAAEAARDVVVAAAAKIDKFILDVSATNRFGMQDAGGLFLHETVASSPVVKVGNLLRTQLDATYTGGTPGVVLSGHHNSANVSANVTDYVWAGLDVLDNSATAGENVARYAQATKRGVGSTWAGVFELQETVDVASLGGGAVAVEIDLFGNGANNQSNRVAIDVVLGKNNLGGAAYVASYGLRFTPIAGQATLLSAVYTQNAVTNDIVINSQGTRGIFFDTLANKTIGIDFSAAAFSAATIRMAANQQMQFTADGSVKFGYEATGTKMVMRVDATEKVSFDMGTPALRMNGLIVVGTRETGWVAMTGTSDKASVFDTATVTLPQLASRVRALQSALTTHGLIGG
jgi:hypothetical protein